MTAERSEEQRRDLSREADEAEEQRGVREPVDEPRLRDLLHPGPDQRDELAGEEEPEVAVPERAERVSLRLQS